MAALARVPVSLSRLPCHFFNRQISCRLRKSASCHSSSRFHSRAVCSLTQIALPSISSDSLPRVNSSSSVSYFQHGHPTFAGICSCSSSNRLAEHELDVSSASNSSLPVIAAPVRERNTAETITTRFEVAVPVSERPPSSISSLSDALQWRRQAQDLASAVGSEFMDTDGGPEVGDLMRELEWFLDDSVAGYACWIRNLDIHSGSWKISSWREIKDCFNLKLENDNVEVKDNLKATAGDISASFGAFADLSKERYGDPVTEFATDCGCSCDGIREDLVEMGSFEGLDTGFTVLPTATLNRLTDSQDPANSSSKDGHGLQLLLRMSLSDMDSAWKERILKRRPFQYVVAAAHWRDLVLSVMEGVLIPRPETEQLVDLAEVAIRNEKSLAQGVWADLGTGSGAIAIGLARLLKTPGSVVAVDASTTAVAVAKRNVERYRLQNKVNVVQGFWFSPLQDRAGELSGVISNPPYIPTENLGRLQAEVGKHEPTIALDGGPDGADDLREICNGSAIALRSGGFLALETNDGRQAEVIQDYLCRMRILERSGTPESCFCDVKCVKDFAGVTRFVTATRS